MASEGVSPVLGPDGLDGPDGLNCPDGLDCPDGPDCLVSLVKHLLGLPKQVKKDEEKTRRDIAVLFLSAAKQQAAKEAAKLRKSLRHKKPKTCSSISMADDLKSETVTTSKEKQPARKIGAPGGAFGKPVKKEPNKKKGRISLDLIPKPTAKLISKTISKLTPKPITHFKLRVSAGRRPGFIKVSITINNDTRYYFLLHICLTEEEFKREVKIMVTAICISRGFINNESILDILCKTLSPELEAKYFTVKRDYMIKNKLYDEITKKSRKDLMAQYRANYDAIFAKNNGLNHATLVEHESSSAVSSGAVAGGAGASAGGGGAGGGGGGAGASAVAAGGASASAVAAAGAGAIAFVVAFAGISINADGFAPAKSRK